MFDALCIKDVIHKISTPPRAVSGRAGCLWHRLCHILVESFTVRPEILGGIFGAQENSFGTDLVTGFWNSLTSVLRVSKIC